MNTSLTWRVGHTSNPDIAPEEFVPATVPGAVQLDWARAHGWPQPEYDPDLSKYDWMEDAYWLYRTQLAFESNPHERLFFICKGIDYQFEVRLNGRVLYQHEGMFTPVKIDLTSENAKPADTLEVLVFPVPKSCATPVDRNQANQSCKPAVAYGWDFHPRLIPLGIWDEAWLEARPTQVVCIQDMSCEVVLATDLASVAVSVRVCPSTVGTFRVVAKLIDAQGTLVAQSSAQQDVELMDNQICLDLTLNNPALWWPNGQGPQTFYTLEAELFNPHGQWLDKRTQRVAFRRVRLVMHPTQWQEPEVQVFPKGRHTSPITLEVNGRPVFAKGANWVTPSLFPGTVSTEQYRAQLTLMHDANMNIVRCWGGANVQKDVFFDVCDELGILVWQEFPLACNRYEGTSHYLSVLTREARAIIARLRTHPSLAIWCGGNELFNNWSLMTDQDLALRMLNALCYEQDRTTPFLMTSPSMGMAHGGYFFRRDDGQDVFQYFAESHATAYTEFGVPATASAETLRKIIPASELWPPKAGTQWETRHALGAWQADSWLDLPTIADYFGQQTDLDTLVACSHWLQAEGYKAIYEEARRQKPMCAMALCWVLNEPWPTAANNSLISWPCEPKPALAAVAQACRPVLASARIPKFNWQAGETFCIQLFMLNDGPDALGSGRVKAALEIGQSRLDLGEWRFEGGRANTNLAGPARSAVLPGIDADRMTLVLTVDGKSAWDSRYTLLYRFKS